jgi:CHASE1-domain containing sensor protein
MEKKYTIADAQRDRYAKEAENETARLQRRIDELEEFIRGIAFNCQTAAGPRRK